MSNQAEDPRGPEYDDHRVAELAASIAESSVEEPAPLPSLLTVSEVASVLQLKDRTVYNLANEGEGDSDNGLPFFFKIGGSWRARRKDLDAWLDKQAGK